MNLVHLLIVRKRPGGAWAECAPDSPWYPSARLFRQETPGDWSAVLDRIAQGLAAWTSEADPLEG
jgi:hypothetical protein